MLDKFSKMIDTKIIRIIIFTLSCLTVIACGNVEQSYDDYLQKGLKFYSQGEYSKAELELKNAIQKNPDAAESYFYLALLNEKSLNFRAMRVNLQESIKRNPDYIEAREKLAKVHLLFNDLDKATEEVEEIQKLQPENLTALTISAQILENRQKSAESMKIVSQVLAKDADFIDALALKAILLLKKRNYDEALATVDHALNVDQDNMSFHLLKVQLHGLKKDNAAVIADYQVLSELQPDNDEIKFALAKAYLKNEEQQQAVAILRDLIQDNPANTKAKLMLLEFLSVVDREKSIEQLNSFLIASGPDERIELAKWALSKKNIEKAREILNRLVTEQENANSAKQTALYLLAGLSFQQRDYQKALKWSEELLRVNPDYVDAKVLKAGILLNTSKVADAEELLNNILWEKPDSDSALVLLAKIFHERGEKDRANNKFLEAFKINPANKQALLPLVDNALKNKHNDYAKELIQTSIARGGGSLDLLNMLAKINMAEKNWKDAQKVIEAIERKKNGQLLSQYLTAQMLTQQQKYGQAIKLYQQILHKYPWHAASLAAMATGYEKIGKREQMLDYLADFSKKHPNNTAARLLTSRFLVLNNKTDQAIELLKDYLKINSYAAPVYNELARLFFSQGEKESALNAYRQGLLKKPNNIKLLMSLASFYEQDKQPELAIALYEKVLNLNPALDVAKNNLAAILLEQDSEDSIARAIELTKRFKKSEQPYFLDSYAWAQYKSDNVIEALTALRRVIILAPDVPVFRYHLAEVYHHQGNDSAAVSELREALELGKKSPFAEAESAENLLESLLAIK